MLKILREMLVFYAGFWWFVYIMHRITTYGGVNFRAITQDATIGFVGIMGISFLAVNIFSEKR